MDYDIYCNGYNINIIQVQHSTKYYTILDELVYIEPITMQY